MRVWENRDCQKVFDKLRTIYSTMMCAGGKSGMDTCQVKYYSQRETFTANLCTKTLISGVL